VTAFDEGMERIRASFRGRAPAHSAELRAALAAGDREGLRTLAHKLCGTAGTLGFSEVSEVAMQLEDLLDQGAVGEDVRPAAEALAQCLDREAAPPGAAQ
jgi:HPt (histidine-containing phosphotransfer) domain-containing protein